MAIFSGEKNAANCLPLVLFFVFFFLFVFFSVCTTDLFVFALLLKEI